MSSGNGRTRHLADTKRSLHSLNPQNPSSKSAYCWLAWQGAVLGGGSSVNAGYFVVEPHYWDSPSGWLACASPEERRRQLAETWSRSAMTACAERARLALGIEARAPDLVSPLASSFLRACEKQVGDGSGACAVAELWVGSASVEVLMSSRPCIGKATNPGASLSMLLIDQCTSELVDNPNLIDYLRYS